MGRKPGVAAAILAVLALAGCGWAYPGYDSANTGYNGAESTLSASNISGLQLHWGGSFFGTNEILVAKARAYVSDTNRVTVYDAAGKQNCSGAPALCQPLLVFNRPLSCSGCSSFAVADDTVYAWSGDSASPPSAAYIQAFDATGAQGCDTNGSCSPLRTYGFRGANSISFAPAPIVVNGILYATSASGGVAAFDADGVRGCTTTAPIVCQPLWAGATTANSSSSPVVAQGKVYVATQSGSLNVFDAAGITNCSAAEQLCSPLWTSPPGQAFLFAPAVANGRVYASDYFGQLRVWDAAGTTGCSGTPLVCAPLWTSAQGPPGSGTGSPVATSTYTLVPTTGDVLMYDAQGKTGCSGTPLICTPTWSAGIGGRVTGANGLAVIFGMYSGNAALAVVDTKTQHPSVLWSLPLTTDAHAADAIIADGSLLVIYSDYLRSYGLG